PRHYCILIDVGGTARQALWLLVFVAACARGPIEIPAERIVIRAPPPAPPAPPAYVPHEVRDRGFGVAAAGDQVKLDVSMIEGATFLRGSRFDSGFGGFERPELVRLSELGIDEATRTNAGSVEGRWPDRTWLISRPSEGATPVALWKDN